MRDRQPSRQQDLTAGRKIGASEVQASFLRRHWQGIALAVVTAALVALVNIVVPGAAGKFWERMTSIGDSEIDPEAIGNWEFVGFESETPEPISTGMMEVTYEYRTLVLRDDGSYMVSGRLFFFGGEDSQSFGDAGTYEATGENTIRFESAAEEGLPSVFDIDVEGDTLRLIDTSVNVVHVFQRV